MDTQQGTSMNDKLKLQLSDMRQRANDQLDGMTKGRERVAKDVLELCSLVERQRYVIEKLEAAAAKSPGLSQLFEDIFPGKRTTRH